MSFLSYEHEVTWNGKGQTINTQTFQITHIFMKQIDWFIWEVFFFSYCISVTRHSFRSNSERPKAANKTKLLVLALIHRWSIDVSEKIAYKFAAIEKMYISFVWCFFDKIVLVVHEEMKTGWTENDAGQQFYEQKLAQCNRLHHRCETFLANNKFQENCPIGQYGEPKSNGKNCQTVFENKMFGYCLGVSECLHEWHKERARRQKRVSYCKLSGRRITANVFTKTHQDSNSIG